MRRPSAPGFTLIELLVVISIIALLIGILLPALASSRETARLTTCGTNLHQIGVGVASYAADESGRIPSGPPGTDPNTYLQDPTAYWDRVATSQVWIGDTSDYGAPNTPQRQYLALGMLLKNNYLSDNRAMYCPGDDTTDPQKELPRIGTPKDAFSSYFYRQLQETSADKIEGLGYNTLNNPARALAFDSQSQLPGIPNGVRSNHENKYVNLLYLDGHVIRVAQVNNRLAVNSMSFVARLAQMLQNADFVENSPIDNVPNP